jgi:hypothetical protein
VGAEPALQSQNGFRIGPKQFGPKRAETEFGVVLALFNLQCIYSFSFYLKKTTTVCFIRIGIVTWRFLYGWNRLLWFFDDSYTDETDCCGFVEVKRKTILRSICNMVLSTVCFSQTKNLSLYIFWFCHSPISRNTTKKRLRLYKLDYNSQPPKPKRSRSMRNIIRFNPHTIPTSSPTLDTNFFKLSTIAFLLTALCTRYLIETLWN